MTRPVVTDEMVERAIANGPRRYRIHARGDDPGVKQAFRNAIESALDRRTGERDRRKVANLNASRARRNLCPVGRRKDDDYDWYKLPKPAPQGASVCSGNASAASTEITEDVSVGCVSPSVSLRVGSTWVNLDRSEVSALIKALQERIAPERAPGEPIEVSEGMIDAARVAYCESHGFHPKAKSWQPNKCVDDAHAAVYRAMEAQRRKEGGIA